MEKTGARREKHLVLPSHVGDIGQTCCTPESSRVGDNKSPICSPTLSRAFTSENFTYEKTNLARDWPPEARKKSEKVLFSLKMRMLINVSILKC